jgi:23S rRNA pseudouridine955/2504/2580 synthase/23S rRNA pseudouridine1911/1915/1917 synthase
MKLPEILFENDEIIALNKPAGLLSVPDRIQSAPSLKDLLTEKYRNIFTVHRLDRETSGVIVFAKTPESHQYMSVIFQERQVEKKYFGIVWGVPAVSSGIIELPMMEHPGKNGTMVVNRKGKAASTGYELLENFGRYSLIQFHLFTGRTHQIRVHMKETGHPILCDPLYGDGKPFFVSSLKKNYKHSEFEEEKPILNRLALHAALLSFTDQHGKKFTLEAEMPKDLRALINQMQKSLKRKA